MRKKYKEPQVGADTLGAVKGKKVLIVDDMAITGKTLEKVGEIVKQAGAGEIKTLVILGRADFSCFPYAEKISFPWEGEIPCV